MEEKKLDWGVVTPDAYNDANREALHILNVNFAGEQNQNRVIKFAVARMLHFHMHLPKGSSQRIRFDLRGQFISNKDLQVARQAIAHEAVKHNIKVSIEFLTN